MTSVMTAPSAPQDNDVVYLSLPPGAVPGGSSATLRNVTSGVSLTTTLISGGFDPVPLAGAVGDSIDVVVADSSGNVALRTWAVVAASRPPVVVRTQPPVKKTDVPLNAVMVMVFSEPVDPGTINSGTIGLQVNSQPVAGGASLLSDGLHATFTPDAPLAPQTTYTLVITTGVADLAGQHLAQALQVSFTTGAVAATVASVTLEPSLATVAPGGTVRLEGVLRDSAGQYLDAYNPAAPALSWSSDDPAVAVAAPSGLVEGFLSGVVSGQASGTVTITATSEGRSATAKVTVARLTFASVSAGDQHSCGITTTGDAYCWGWNLYGGALGTGDSNSFLATTTPVRVAGGLSFAAISAGTVRTCGITTGGAAYCWGDGRSGALGNGGTANAAVPVPVAGGLNLAAISLGLQHACVVTTTGAAYCWGSNWAGQLGDGGTADSPVPVKVAGGFSFIQIAAGADHTCALTASGAAYCWGSGSAGQLGTGETSSAATPVPVTGGLSFGVLTAGSGQTCGLTLAGSAYCWGVANAGLGVDTTSGCFRATRCTTPTPVVGGLIFSALGRMSRQTQSVCVVTSAGAPYCWGEIWGAADGVPRGFSGKGGSYGPQLVGGGIQFASISVGGYHYCGLSVTGVVYCWGGNQVGQLGDGSFFIASDTPVKVAGQP